MPRSTVLVGPAVCICLQLCFLTAVWPLPVEKQSSSVHARQTYHGQRCGFVGNSDIYGLGIRLGTYLQWVAALISKQYLATSRAEVLRELLDVNNIFCLAIFVATLLLQTQGASNSNGPTRAIEILIMLHIFFGNTYIVSYEQLLKGKHLGSQTFLGITFMTLITAAMSSYAIYFWFFGLKYFPATGCSTFAFLFAKVDLFGPARTFFKIAAVLNMIPWGVGAGAQLFFSVPMLLYGVFDSLIVNMNHYARWMANCLPWSNIDVLAPWRQSNHGHLRFTLGIYATILGVPKGVEGALKTAESDNIIV
ncbi:uncharacterized protein KY384_005961 [Bacidia gigantensis]|uniref:uncharacterized protein n=1 Tax=Bacidia gigantensis TaxID=2732470 RepID=UPI001D059551|nr:uncharacterized protein KY384_005961 [Bacidia gigantensis]KAG8529325.1 hypothetical protein KY384_005961 [Bacidia gigantensis]